MRRAPFGANLAVCLGLTLLSTATTLTVQAQTRKKSQTRSANVLLGTFVSTDAAAGTIVVKPKTGPEITYRLTDKTHVLRDKKTVEPAAFKTGDAIVVRFRKSTAGPASLYDLTDKASWEWLDRLRHETVAVTVVEITDEALKGVEGADKAEVEYRVTEKTSWQKSGKSAEPSDFKPGDRVFVVPRLLPGGNIMATAVADGAESAATLKERAKSTVTGVVRAVDANARKLKLHTAAGDDRELTLAPDVVVRLGSKDVPLGSVRAGQTVSAHLSRSVENELLVARITIQTRKSTPRKPAKPAKPLLKLPVKP